MPSHWEKLLQQSKISKQEQQQNPQAVLNALKYYTRAAATVGEGKKPQKWLQQNDYDSNFFYNFIKFYIIFFKFCIIYIIKFFL